MNATVVRAELSEQPIDLAEHESLVLHRAAGAVVGFVGMVRDHDGGQSVTRLEYSAHPTAQQTLAEVAAEIARDCEGVRAIAVSHRIGTLDIGDAAWWPPSPPITARRRSTRAHCSSTPSRRGCQCGSTSCSPMVPTNGWARPSSPEPAPAVPDRSGPAAAVPRCRG